MTDTSLLRAEDLTVGYGRTPLLEGIRLDLPSGSLTALIGINGIGKSTLLRTLAGLHPPMVGEVLLDGTNVHTMSAMERARRIAVVLTGRPQVGMLDVETLVGLGRQPWTDRWGRTTAADKEAVESALERSGAIASLNPSASTIVAAERKPWKPPARRRNWRYPKLSRCSRRWKERRHRNSGPIPAR